MKLESTPVCMDCFIAEDIRYEPEHSKFLCPSCAHFRDDQEIESELYDQYEDWEEANNANS